MLNQKRIARVRGQMERFSMKQILITDPIAIYWLTSKMYHPGERFLGLLIKEDGEPILFLNDLFPYDGIDGVCKVGYSDTDPVMELVKEHLITTEVLGVDKIMCARFLLSLMDLKSAGGYVNGSLAIDTARALKDEEEIALMRKSSHINDLVMEEVVKLVHPNVTEIEIADQIMDLYLKHGATGFSFDPIVSFGANAADPHHEPDDTVLQEGDCVLFDIGGVVDGYCSDMTRTFFYKSCNETQRKVYELVREANESGEAMVRPGIALKRLDLNARKVITDGGYGENFTHRLGHFCGIEDHEFGDVSSVNESLTEVGNIFSIEPGIYVPGVVGVRIEDLVVVTEDGVEVLNQFPKELQIIE